MTLGQIVALLEEFRAQPQTLMVPEIPHNSFAKKLYSTYLRKMLFSSISRMMQPVP